MAGAAVVGGVVAATFAAHQPFPSDRTPEGAYLRIAKAVQEDHIEEVFPYLETEAQWASYTIKDARAQACERVRRSYPKGEGEELVAAYSPLADKSDGADVFATIARQRGFVARLRRDLSAVARVETDADRATVVTQRGTRYPFHRRDNGIWGMTLFTASLLAEAEKASRDIDVVTMAAGDYDKARGGAPPPDR